MPESREEAQSKSHAKAYEPSIGVHTLSEFVFCPRAGICSHDLAGEDDGEEDNNRPGFYHLPIYFDKELDQRRIALAKTALHCVLLGGAMVIGTIACGFFVHPIFHVAAMFCGTVTLGTFAMLLFQISRVEGVLEEWLAVNGDVPDHNITEPTIVHWPNFFVAGYRPEQPQDAMKDEQWKLAGKPWRIFHYGGRVIPVFLRNVTEDSAAIVDDPELPELYDQHLVRIAAYCHLIEVSMGRESPYGIVLTRGTLKGVAIPNTESNREMLVAAMAGARETMREIGREPSVRPVINEQLCRRCPHGAPAPLSVSFPYRETDEEQKKPRELTPYSALARPQAKNGEGRRYHSHCRDRFKQIPPHEAALRLGLEEPGSS